MTEGVSAGASPFRVREPRRAANPVVPLPAVTVYGCGSEEADLFREAAPRLGTRLTVVPEPLSDENAALAAGSRCVSVDHRRRVPNATLDALRRAGVCYLCTRSVGYDHIDLTHARSVGMAVGNVCYSPDSVADYTLMLMLMAARGAAATLRRTNAHDYRLPEERGRELRDLTVGVVGTGRIGTAVIERLAGTLTAPARLG